MSKDDQELLAQPHPNLRSDDDSPQIALQDDAGGGGGYIECAMSHQNALQQSYDAYGCHQ